MRSDARRLQVVVLHRDPLLSAGLMATLGGEPELEVSVGPRARPWPTEGVLLVDYEQAIELLAPARRGRERRPAPPRILLLTGRDSEWEIRRALELGVCGYLTLGCSLEELKAAVHAVELGLRYVGAQAAQRLADAVACEGLTARETEVVRCVAEGCSNKLIAQQLGIAVGTVKAHLKIIFQKLGARSRTQVVALADRRGLLRLPREIEARANGRAGPGLGAPPVHAVAPGAAISQ